MLEKSKILLVGKSRGNKIDLEIFKAFLTQAADLQEAGNDAAQEDFACCLVFLEEGEEVPLCEEPQWHSETPLIFIGEADEDAVRRAYRYGAVDFIGMPCDAMVLRNKLQFYGRVREAHTRLVRENARLEELNIRIKKFVGNLAHDLRGPLGKLINTAEILLAGVDQDSLKTFYNIMVKTSRRGFDLVNDILDLTALESGQIKMEMDRCDLAELARQVITEMNWQAEEKEIQLINEIHFSHVVKADRNRLFQVLTNLIGNAIKFTPRLGTISLSAESTRDGTRLEVRDTGVGMATEAMGNLFEVHHRVTTPGTEGEKGTGFGLALAQEIVHRHGSEITVRSKAGEGSSFSFVLPTWKVPQAKVH